MLDVIYYASLTIVAVCLLNTFRMLLKIRRLGKRHKVNVKSGMSARTRLNLMYHVWKRDTVLANCQVYGTFLIRCKAGGPHTHQDWRWVQQ